MLESETSTSRIAFAIFLAVVFSLGVMKPSVDAGFASLTHTDLIFPIAFLVWIVSIATGRLPWTWHVGFLPLALYLLALTISAIFSVDPQLSFRKLPGVVYLVLLAIMTASIVTTSERLRLTVLVWIAGSVLPLLAAFAGLGLFYFAPQNSLLPELTYHYGAVPVGNFPRISSTFVSPSMFCNYLTVTMALTLIAARSGWISRKLGVVLLIAIGIAALFTVSIALGGAFLMAGLWIWISDPKKPASRIALVLSIVAAAGFLAISPFSLKKSAPNTSSFTSLDPSSRYLVWSDAQRTFIEDPITGRGVGTAVANVTFQNTDGSWSLLTDAHNTFLSVAAQGGIIALIAILAIVIVTLRSARLSVRDDDHLIRATVAAAFVAAFVYQGLTSSFEDARHLWILIGLILAAGRNSGSLDST